MSGRRVRAEQIEATRGAILDAAERLFAELGVHTVSNRQIAIAAEQGNTGAVGYHFGTKADLVRAIAHRHMAAIEEIRDRMTVETGDLTSTRHWAANMVRPITEHLASLGVPTWFARFNAQVSADPGLFEIVTQDSLLLSMTQELKNALDRLLPDVAPEVIAVRVLMTRHLLVQMCVETERALAEGSSLARLNWNDTADDLIDVIVALLEAPAR
ncbi:TetR/AcrR family transcriptional regulator [Streptomyces sp. NBC_01451]|uniref:TetR/AcrR family transcriptional regulator n=1 Tax=Streptomyces sp. NBC_01451 TaxID=2903872 RepID=UPI002E328C15|nr:TetR family transcriptional regulator [Streptomyces sp. NBC_01451]